MTDTTEYRTCPICSGDDLTIAWNDPAWQALRCSTCEIIYINKPRDSASYSDEYYSRGYLEHERVRRVFFEQRLADLESLVPERRVLDVGAGVGFFLTAARSRGWQVKALEPAEYAASQLRALDIECHHVDLLHYDPAGVSYPLVTAWDVLTNVQDLRLSLEKLHVLVAPNGYLVVKTGYRPLRVFRACNAIAGLTLRNERVIRLLRGQLHHPFQLFHFSPRSLANALQLSGFRVVHVERTREPVTNWMRMRRTRGVKMLAPILLSEFLRLLIGRDSIIIYAQKADA